MRLVIIGGVAAGTSAGAKARRNSETDEIIIYDKDEHISYSGCGMPYFLGGIIEDVSDLTPRDPKFFKSKYNIDVFIKHEVLSINPQNKTLTVKNLQTDEIFNDKYDTLIIATGAKSSIIDIPGINSPYVFTLRNITDVKKIKNFIDKRPMTQPFDVVIAGSGFIGMELCESFKNLGFNVTIIEKLNQVAPSLDEDMSGYVKDQLLKNGIYVITDTIIQEIESFDEEQINKVATKSLNEMQVGGRDLISQGIVKVISNEPQISETDNDCGIELRSSVRPNEISKLQKCLRLTLSDGRKIDADMLIISTGVVPSTILAKNAGIETATNGAIKVNSSMQTNFPSIYACGDCCEQFSIITGKLIYKPLGSTANKTGRIAGDCASGGNSKFRGVLGTGIYRLFDMTIATTGLTEREALIEGFEIATCHNIKPDKPEYMGGREMVIKAVADKKSGRLLGVQIVGFEGVDKRIDVFVTAITFKAKVEDLFHLDLAYAPPFSTTKDPVMYTGMILDNAINKQRPLISPKELSNLIKSGDSIEVIDARVVSQYEEGHVETANAIPHSKLREAADNLDKEKITVTYCNKGVTGNAAQNILINKGFKKVFNLSGGYKQYKKNKN